ncbi:MAG: molybdenum cofactor biosynthesis protein MoaE [Candidatus Cybelea sp.]
MDRELFSIVRGPVDPSCLDGLADDALGGVVTFLGVVRNRSDDGRAVLGLSYEAYEAPAVREFETIANEARERFGEVRLAIVHAVGELDVGAVAVAVGAAAEHRAAAFDACRYAIDEVKRRAPIWKKERYGGGEARWKSNE